MNLANPQPPHGGSGTDHPGATGRDGQRGRGSARRCRRLEASCETLEGRQLLSVAGAGNIDPAMAAQVHRDVRQLTAEIRSLARHSKVTPSEFMAFERDMYDVMDSPLDLVSPNDPSVISLEVDSANLVDSSFFDGGLDAQGWATITTQLENNLNQLAYSPTQVSVSQIVSDMQQIAKAANVSQAHAQVVFSDVMNLYNDEMSPGAPATPEPWAQVVLPNLRSFVHGKG